MSVEMKLKSLILEKYKSLREFAIKIDMPYSTVDTILKRGTDKANIVNILKICKELNIDAEALGEGRIQFKIKTIARHDDDEEWTEEELEEIERFKDFIKARRDQKK